MGLGHTICLCSACQDWVETCKRSRTCLEIACNKGWIQPSVYKLQSLDPSPEVGHHSRVFGKVSSGLAVVIAASCLPGSSLFMPLLRKGNVNQGSLCWPQPEEGQTQTTEKDAMDTSLGYGYFCWRSTDEDAGFRGAKWNFTEWSLLPMISSEVGNEPCSLTPVASPVWHSDGPETQGSFLTRQAGCALLSLSFQPDVCIYSFFHSGTAAMRSMGHSLLPFFSLACSSSGKWASMPIQAEESLRVRSLTHLTLVRCVWSRSESLGLRCCVRIAVMFVGLVREKLQHSLNVSFLLIVFILRQVIFYLVEISSINEEPT